MPRISLILTMIFLNLLFAEGAQAHGGDRADRADRADREREDRSRDNVERDRERAEERSAKDETDRQRELDRRSADEVADIQGEDRGGGDDVSPDVSDNAEPDAPDADNSGSGNESALAELDEDDSSGHGSGGSDDADDLDDADESDSGDDESSEDDESKDDGGKGSSYASVTFDDDGHAYRERELVVRVGNSGDLAQIESAGLPILEARAMRRNGSLVVRVGVPADMRATDALQRLSEAVPGQPVSFNHVYTQSGAGTKPAPTSVGLPMARSGRAVRQLAVLDGFSGARVAGGHVVEAFVDKRALTTHGDDVLSVLFGDLSAHGAAPPKRLLVADVVEQAESAAPSASVLGLVDALDWAAFEGADVINVSLSGPPNPLLEQIVEELAEEGVLIVAAVGNSGPATRPGYPAAYSGAVGVTAVDKNGKPYLYAARGEEVELAVEAVSLSVSEGSEPLSGTSFAAPRIAALAALMSPDLPLRQVKEALRALAVDMGTPGRDEVYGFGMIPAPPAAILVANRSAEQQSQRSQE